MIAGDGPIRRGRHGRRTSRNRFADGWFTDHPQFLETSQTAIGLRRLNMRHQALIADNVDILAGARVLDIASHDGRWSLAALDAGAAHVTGVEARPELVDQARKTLALYGADERKYTFETGDIFAVLQRERFEVDVIQCFGFLYHTLRYPELFSRLRGSEPRYLVMDTKVHQADDDVIKLSINEAKHPGHAAVDDYSEGTKTLVGSPSPSALRRMLRVYGFRVEREFDWATAGRAANAAVGPYEEGARITWRCTWEKPTHAAS